MKREVGQMVRIRSNLKPETLYGGTSTSKRMSDMRGKFMQITHEHKTVSGKIVYKLDDEYGYWWTEEMFEPAKHTVDDVFMALLNGQIDEETYEALLEVKETWN